MGEEQASGRHVVVVGAGISGLAAAHALSSTPRPPRVTVLEASPQIGGKLRVGDLEGLPVDEGAESVLARRPEALDLIRAVGVDPDLVHPATTAASVWSRGSLRPLPTGTLMGVPTDLASLAASGVLSLRGLLRVPLDHVLPATPVDGDVSIGSYVRARLGGEVSERLVEPLLGGVYAGHADQLSLAATVPALAGLLPAERSLLRAAAATRRTTAGVDPPTEPPAPVFASVRGGLGRLPAAVATASGAHVRTGATVRALGQTTRGWRLTVGPAAAPEQIDADAVVVAVPAAPAAHLLHRVVPVAAGALREIPYASVAVASYVYPRVAFPRLPPGSGFLVPPIEGRLVKAATFLTSKWAWLGTAAGSDRVVVRASIGRHGDEAVLQRDDDDLLAAAASDLAAMTGAVAGPLASRLSRWGGGLPQYLVGHVDRVARIRLAVGPVPGLEVCGAAYDGIGVAACVAGAQDAATRVLAELDRARQ